MARTKALLSRVLGVLLVGLLMQLAGHLRGDALVFPGVGAILTAFLRLLAAPATWRMVGTTLLHLVLSLGVSALLGVALGLIEGLSPFARGLLSPLMALLRSIPMIVLVVVIMVLTKYERVPLIATCAILVPLISEAACAGCLGIEPELIDVYRLNSGLTLRVILRVYLPLMAGYLRQAWISAAGSGLKLVISCEYLVQSKHSLGKAIYSSSYFNEFADIYAYALIMILLVFALADLPTLLLRRAGREEGA